ncbi:low temperature requirement protein LtrA [Micromonospora pisi]|uniref:Low temperature requirement protein LtrA n=1 Tax=Micromonospora pisi TaxID=589240 RepID=A0A495JGY2_9ACTN|nr:low temperature requirement protein A [Micromonospora pisi]RKR87644.1 low temperature requirement protein LtrA [Micromonospora pisi]
MTWWHPADERRGRISRVGGAVPIGLSRPRLRLRETELPVEQDERHATWLELFFDLVFALALATVQNRLDTPTPHFGDLVATFGLYAVVWLAWVGQAFYDTRFDPDDFYHRLAVLVTMVGAGAMAIGAASPPHTLLLPIGYIVVRLSLLLLYLRVRHTTPITHRLTSIYLIGFGIGVLFWVGSLAAPVSLRPVLWAIGLMIEFLTPWLGRSWESRIPVDARHLPERLGQFTIILLGTTLTDLRDVITPRPPVEVVTAAGVALIIPAAVWWVYTTFVTTGMALPRLSAGLAYSYVHSILGAALLLLGWALGEILGQVNAHATDLPDRLRVLLALALDTWIVCGLGLQWVSLGYVTRYRLLVALTGLAPMTLITLLVSDPLTLLGLLAATVVGYAILVSRHIARLGNGGTTGP